MIYCLMQILFTKKICFQELLTYLTTALEHLTSVFDEYVHTQVTAL